MLVGCGGSASPAPASPAGESLVHFHNATPSNAGVTFAGVAKPHIVDDVLVWIQDLDLSVEPVLPDWIVPLRTQVGADAMGDREAVVSLPIGTVAALCVSGEWPKLAFTPAPPLELASP